MRVERWSPMQELEALERRMRQLFAQSGAEAALPSADVYETADEFVVQIEAPGFDREELETEIVERVLVVRGNRSEESEQTEKTFHRRERLEASFERRIPIPSDADTDRVAATFAKGVLEIRAPRAAGAGTRKVEIASA